MLNRTILLIVMFFITIPTLTFAQNNEPSNIYSPQFETRVFARRQCILSEPSVKQNQEFFAALGAILIPILVEKVIDGIGNKLSEAGEVKTLKSSGNLPTYLYLVSKDEDDKEKDKLKLNPNLGCLIVIRGKFQTSEPFPEPDEIEQYDSLLKFPDGNTGILGSSATNSQRIARLRASNIPVTEIGLAYESAIIPSNDGSALYFENRYLQINSFQGKRSADERGVVITISMNGVLSGSGKPTALSAYSTNFGEIQRNNVLGPDFLRGQKHEWLGGLGMSKESEGFVNGLGLEEGEEVKVMPITINAEIAETDDGNAALRFFGSVLTAKKGELAKLASDTALKDRKALAEEKKKEEEEKKKAQKAKIDALINEERQAYLRLYKAVKAPKDDDSEVEKMEKALEIEAAQREWCEKRQLLTDAEVTLPDRAGVPACP